MATQDVPGANPANADQLHAGCWAEHADGSLIYVKGSENKQIVYEIYDLAQDPPVYYQDAMREEDFKQQFSFPPIGQAVDKWVWHDKTTFPWHKVMKTFDKPRPVDADVYDTLSAAARIAQSLRLRAQKIDLKDVGAAAAGEEQQQVPKAGRSIIQRLQKALDAFVEG